MVTAVKAVVVAQRRLALVVQVQLLAAAVVMLVPVRVLEQVWARMEYLVTVVAVELLWSLAAAVDWVGLMVELRRV